MKKIVISFLLLSSFIWAQNFQVGKNGAVASASKQASDVGIEVLKNGGNAVDAAIAVGFALAVVYPPAGNIGGGGFMLICSPEGEVTAIDFREKASRSARRDMYLDESGNPVDGWSTEGALAVGVPGSVAGYEYALQHYGSMKWNELLAPAIKLAEDGFPVSYYIHEGLRDHQKLMRRFPASVEMFYQNDSVPDIGDTLRFSDLAVTLKRIAKQGAGEFYRGRTAKRLVKAVRDNGGIIDLWDLQHYEVKERKPIRFTYRGYDIFSMPLPSSGGICLAQILKVVEQFPLAEYGFQALQSIRIITEAERRAYANRAHYLGDPDFISVPVDYLLSDELIRAMAKSIDLTKATPSCEVDHAPLPKSEETTHFSVVDKDGWAVAVTTTLNSAYGSGFVAGKTGILLNNEMDDFSIKTGMPNMYGLVGAEANAIQPQKRMLSSMTPTIVCRNDSLMWVLGTPGGGTIITTVVQVLINMIDYNMTLVQAVDAPRFHHQWLPDVIFAEKYSFSPDLIDLLQAKGYTIRKRSSIGDVNAIAVDRDNKYYIAVPDKRRQSAASVY
ncbi:MAG: gamma-glutamyltransferase [Candidatus Marinimicrobia bacterium]|nr:gamma-glutamyltransferase [Candidatus Neomarinimicrobiota bacterium]